MELLIGIPGESDVILRTLAGSIHIIVGSLSARIGKHLKNSLCLCKQFSGCIY